MPKERRTPKGEIQILGAREHNLRNVDVTIPLGVLVCVTGVSGAGKSSLVNGILLPALAAPLHGSTDPIGAHKAIKGIEALDKVIAIDQKPIGRTPRSNPGTYTKSRAAAARPASTASSSTRTGAATPSTEARASPPEATGTRRAWTTAIRAPSRTTSAISAASSSTTRAPGP